jgi:hypothetical protein
LLSFFLKLYVTSSTTTFVFKVFYFDHSCSHHCQFSETISHIDSFLEVTVSCLLDGLHKATSVGYSSLEEESKASLEEEG